MDYWLIKQWSALQITHVNYTWLCSPQASSLANRKPCFIQPNKKLSSIPGKRKRHVERANQLTSVLVSRRESSRAWAMWKIHLLQKYHIISFNVNVSSMQWSREEWKKNIELYKMSGKLHSVFLFFAYLESLAARVRSSVMSENIGHLQVVPV